ncbi:MAG: circadian clock KaiB family protein [Chthoniobacterales bacterium]
MSVPPTFKFRLYVAGDGPNSIQAIDNLRILCREYLAERHEIEIVDVLTDQARALQDGVMMTPLLVKLSPQPVRKVIGNLSHRENLLQGLGLPASSPQ